MNEVTDDGFQFRQATAEDFGKNEIVLFPQALDNQWIPRNLLPNLEGGATRSSIVGEINRSARAEYIHSLISANRVVINRAFCINSPVINQDYGKTESKEAFSKLLSDGVLVPFFFNEKNPGVPPAFDHHPKIFDAWKDIAKEANPIALRLSWDKTENAQRIQYDLSRRFHENCEALSGLNPYALHDSLNLPMDNETIVRFKARREQFKKYVASFSEELENVGGTLVQKFAAREHIYKEFICKQGSPVNEGAYDFTKPFAWQIKELVDVVYNVNLPDTLSGQLLTPSQTINRSALQEITTRASQAIDEGELVALVRAIAVDEALNVLAELNHGFNLADLSLEDVVVARSLAEWSEYNEALRSLANSDYLTPGGDHLFNNNALLCGHKQLRFLQRLQTNLLEERLERTAHQIGVAGKIGMTLIAHLSGMEWFQIVLSDLALEGMTHSALQRLKQLGAGKKQLVLSLAFWSQDAQSTAKRNLVKIDVLNKKLESSERLLGAVFRDLSTIAKDKRLPFKEIPDLEDDPNANGIRARESAE